MKRSMLSLISLMAIAVLVQAVVPGALHAEKYKEFYGLFKDIEGWKGEDPDGMAMDMPGMKMIQAKRVYKKGDDEVSAIIMIGSSAMAKGFLAEGEMNFESEEGKSSIKEIDGFMVHRMFDKDTGSGAVMVMLNQGEQEGAYFIFSFENISDEEGLELAKKFDWKAMKKKVESLD